MVYNGFMKKSGIYLIKCCRPADLPLYYVGQSQHVQKRFSQHRNGLRSGRHFNAHLQAAWKKYGEAAFSFELLEEVPVDRLDDAELWWLKEMAGSRFSCNIGTDPVAPSRGRKFTAEHCRRISEAVSGPRHYLFGRKMDDAHRASISAAGKGQKRSAATRAAIARATSGESNAMHGVTGRAHARSRPVESIDPETGATRRYESANLAEKDGFHQAAISRCCHGKSRMHKGLIWRFATAQAA